MRMTGKTLFDFQLPGIIQTVPRAELMSLVLTCTITHNATVFSDCAYVVDGFAKILNLALYDIIRLSNCDLW